MYIVYDKNKKVISYGEGKPAITGELEIAEFDGELPDGDYFTVDNIEKKTREVKTIEFNQYDQPIETADTKPYKILGKKVEVVKRVEYKTCTLTGHKNEIPYEKKVEALIREKYTISDELAILRQREKKPKEFSEYNAYCEDCKQKAKG